MALADRHERREPSSAAAQPSGGSLSARDPERPSGDVCAAIVATLRYAGNLAHVSGQYDIAEMFYSTARDVTQVGADRDVCPVCEEVACDGDCPLAPYRSEHYRAGNAR